MSATPGEIWTTDPDVGQGTKVEPLEPGDGGPVYVDDLEENIEEVTQPGFEPGPTRPA